MVSSTESAITSRDGSDDFMPAWPMAMPSVTVMVQNSRGVAPTGGDALLDRLGLAHQRDIAGRGLVPAGGDADEGLVDLLGGQPHRVIEGAVRAPGPGPSVACRLGSLAFKFDFASIALLEPPAPDYAAGLIRPAFAKAPRCTVL